MTAEQQRILGFFEAAIQAVAGFESDRGSALQDGRKIDLNLRNAQSELRGAARQVSDPGGSECSFGRRAAEVNAGSAEVAALGHRNLHASLGEREGQRCGGLSSADD